MRRDLYLALALVAALLTTYAFGRCAERRGVELRAWQDSTAAAHHTADSARRAYMGERDRTEALSVSLDSALAAWRRAVAERPSLPSLPGPATVTPGGTDPLYTPGVSLAASCSAYKSACELALGLADSAIEALRDENDLLRRRPDNPAARRLQPWVAFGVDPLARVPGARVGVDLRLFTDWTATAEADWRIAPGDTARLWVGVRRSF